MEKTYFKIKIYDNLLKQPAVEADQVEQLEISYYAATVEIDFLIFAIHYHLELEDPKRYTVTTEYQEKEEKGPGIF